MVFKKIAVSSELLEKLIRLETIGDFNEFAEKSENKNYLFLMPLSMDNENGEEINVSEVKIVFDVESKTFFAYQKDLVPEEEIERLNALSKDSDSEEDNPILMEDKINQLEIPKDELISVLKDYIKENSCADDNFVNDQKFKVFLLKRIKKLKEIINGDYYELSNYFEELMEEPTLAEQMGEFKEVERKKKEEKYDIIAHELVENSDYVLAKAEARKAFITEQLFKHKIYDAPAKDIMWIKGKTEVLINKLK